MGGGGQDEKNGGLHEQKNHGGSEIVSVTLSLDKHLQD